jgi:hypothetical protein
MNVNADHAFQVVLDIPDEKVIEARLDAETTSELLSEDTLPDEEAMEYEGADIVYAVVFGKNSTHLPDKGTPRIQPEIHYEIYPESKGELPAWNEASETSPGDQFYDDLVAALEEAEI